MYLNLNKPIYFVVHCMNVNNIYWITNVRAAAIKWIKKNRLHKKYYIKALFVWINVTMFGFKEIRNKVNKIWHEVSRLWHSIQSIIEQNSLQLGTSIQQAFRTSRRSKKINNNNNKNSENVFPEHWLTGNRP